MLNTIDHRHPTPPVLLIAFNRPRTTKLVFSKIRQAKPTQLFISIDGPRGDHPEDHDNVAAVLKIFQGVDWDCKVHFLVQPKNLGCRYAPIAAIDWFFSNVEAGVILEDDCVPHVSFFDFCSWGLKKYRSDANVWHIGGNNFGANVSLFKENCAFVPLAQVWGWATWSDRWQKYERNIFNIKRQFVLNKSFINWRVGLLARFNKLKHICDVSDGLDAWDYSWQAVILNNSGLCLVPSENLITNIGDGIDATHTCLDKRLHLATNALDIQEQQISRIPNDKLTRFFEKQMGLRSIRGAFYGAHVFLKSTFKTSLRELICKMLFGTKQRLIVASTGRAGSTMMTLSIADSYRRNSQSRFVILSKIYQRFLTGYEDRLSDINFGSSLIIKTHSLPRATLTNVKVLFVFGDPLDSVLSAKEMEKQHGLKWFEEHIFHLESKSDPINWLEHDVLNFEDQLKQWLSADNVLAIHYTDIWKYKHYISEFIGFELVLPVRTNRATKPDTSLYRNTLYARLKDIENDAQRSHFYKSQFH